MPYHVCPLGRGASEEVFLKSQMSEVAKGSVMDGGKIVHIVCPDRENFGRALKGASSNSLDFILVVTAQLDPGNPTRLKEYLGECMRVLKNGGLLFVQGRPDYLPELGVYLDRRVNFKQWLPYLEDGSATHCPICCPKYHIAVTCFLT